MRFVSLIPAVAALFISGAACAQGWDVYQNRDNFFSINLPGAPAVTEMPYKTVKGTDLSARVFTAVAPPGSILSGKYTVTVVDYSTAKDEINTAVEQAREAVKAKGTTKYDGINALDLQATRRLTVETPNVRILAEILFAANNHLYITQSETALNVPPPANFQASLQILNDEGARIRTRTVLGLPPDQTIQTGAGGVPNQPDAIAAKMMGAWRTAGGTCEAAYFKAGTRTKTSRGEEALSGTVTNAGTSIDGLVIVNGAREGQFIDPMSLLALMVFDPKDDGKLVISGLNGPAANWGDATLELCPGSRG